MIGISAAVGVSKWKRQVVRHMERFLFEVLCTSTEMTCDILVNDYYSFAGASEGAAAFVSFSFGVTSRLVVDPPVPLPHESCLRIWSASGRVGLRRPLALGFEAVRDIEGDVASAGGA